MSNIDDSKTFYSLIDDLNAFYSFAMKPKLSTEEEQLAKIRERQRRQRKEELYSYPSSLKTRS